MKGISGRFKFSYLILAIKTQKRESCKGMKDKMTEEISKAGNGNGKKTDGKIYRRRAKRTEVCWMTAKLG